METRFLLAAGLSLGLLLAASLGALAVVIGLHTAWAGPGRSLRAVAISAALQGAAGVVLADALTREARAMADTLLMLLALVALGHGGASLLILRRRARRG